MARNTLEHITPLFAPIVAERARRYRDDAKAYYRSALAAEDKNRKELAIDYYRAAWLRAGENFPEAANNAGILRFELGQWGRAKASFVAALQVHEGYACAWINLGTVLWHMGRIQNARSCFGRAIACGDFRGVGRARLDMLPATLSPAGLSRGAQ